MKMYSVYDQGVGAFMAPFMLRSKGEAVRQFMNTVSDPKTEFFRHPDHFTLFELGDYDEQSGKFKNHPSPVSCGLALDYHPGKESTEVPDGEIRKTTGLREVSSARTN